MPEYGIVSSSEIGNRIRTRRHQLSLTQEELATMLDVSYQQVQRYESGKDRLNVEKLQTVAKALSVTVSYFFSGADEVFPIEDAREKELISSYRKAQRDEVKNLMVNFAIMVTQWEDGWNGR